MRGLLIGVNAQRFGCFECGCFGRQSLDGPDYCLPAFVRSIRGGFPPTEDPNVGPTLPLFALHASLLIPCSPRHDFSCRGATNGREITPPEHPVFVMGKQTALEIVGRDDQRRIVAVNVARPKGKKLHFVEPTLVERSDSLSSFCWKCPQASRTVSWPMRSSCALI
jgi:hypothetical protein